VILTGTSLQTYLKNLGSFWQQHFVDAGVFDAALSATEELLQEAYYRLMEIYLARDRQQMRLTHRKLWVAVDLDLYNTSPQATPLQAEPGYRIAIDPNITEIPYLYDRIGHPRVVLRQGQDYTVEDGAIIFNQDALRVLLEDPRIARRTDGANIPELADLPGPPRVPIHPPIAPNKPWQLSYPYNIATFVGVEETIYTLEASKETVFEVRLWAPRAELDEQLLQRFWGDLVDLEVSSTEEERLYTDAVLLLYFLGPSAQSFARCANITADLPLVEEDCVLTSVVDDGTNYTVHVNAWRPDGWEAQEYAFNKRYGLRPDAVIGNYNTLILRAGDVLTDFVAYPNTDRNDPEWWKGTVIPEDLFDASAARRAVNTARKRFVFDPADPDYFGDPGLYFGADENGQINEAIEIKDTAADAQTYPVIAPFLDVEDYYLKGDAGELVLLPQVGPVVPPTVYAAYGRLVGQNTLVLEAYQAGALGYEAMVGRYMRINHPNRVLNMSLGSEPRASGVDGEIFGDATRPFRFEDAVANAFTEDLVGGLLRITGRVLDGETVPTRLGTEGDYFIVRHDAGAFPHADQDKIDVVKSNIHATPAGGPYDEFPFPMGRPHVVLPTAVILGNMSGADAECGGEDGAGDIAVSGTGGIVDISGAPDTFEAPGYSFGDYSTGYYLEVYVPAAAPQWYRARFTLASDTILDLTWLDGVAPAGVPSWNGLAWYLKSMGDTVRIKDSLLVTRNVGDEITLSADPANLGNDFLSDIYAVNFVADGGNDYVYLTVDQVIVPPLVGGWQITRTYVHALDLGKDPFLVIDDTETFTFEAEHVGLNVEIVNPALGLFPIAEIISSKVVGFKAAGANRDTRLAVEWELVLTEDALVWEFIPYMADEGQVRLVTDSAEDGATGRILLTLDGPPLAYPYPEPTDLDDATVLVDPAPLGTWDKRALGGFNVAFLEAASLKDASFATSAAVISYFDNIPAGAKIYLGIINQEEFTGVYRYLGIHDIGWIGPGTHGIQWILEPAGDTYSSAQALGTWPPAEWDNSVHMGADVPARWEGVVNLGRAAGTHPSIGFILFNKFLRHSVWGYDIALADLSMGNDRYLFKILDKAIKARPSHTYAMLDPTGSIQQLLNEGFDPEIDLPGSTS